MTLLQNLRTLSDNTSIGRHPLPMPLYEAREYILVYGDRLSSMGDLRGLCSNEAYDLLQAMNKLKLGDEWLNLHLRGEKKWKN